MPGQHSDEERERKERIKKMKIKTSKMRLAVVKKKYATTIEDLKSGLKLSPESQAKVDEELKRTEHIGPKKKSKSAIVKKKSSVYGDYLPPKEAKPAYKELFKKNNITNPKEFNDYADKNKKVLEKSKLPGKDYLSVYSLDNAKKYKKTSD